MTVTKTVHIIGDIAPKDKVYLQSTHKSSNNRARGIADSRILLIKAEWSTPIIWQAIGGSVAFVSFTSTADSPLISLADGAAVAFRYCFIKNTGGVGLSLGSSSSVQIERSSFSGNQNPISCRVGASFDSLILRNCYCKDAVEAILLNSLVTTLLGNSSIKARVGAVVTLNDLVRSGSFKSPRKYRLGLL